MVLWSKSESGILQIQTKEDLTLGGGGTCDIQMMYRRKVHSKPV